jgi:hypothetical protein
MTAIRQYSFDPLTYLDEPSYRIHTTSDAKARARRERDAKMRDLRRSGINCKGWTLTGQLRKYSSFGVEDGRVRPVYYLTVCPSDA